MSDKISLEDAIKVCLEHGHIPLPKQTLTSMVSIYDLMEAAMDGIIRLQLGFEIIMKGQTITQEAAKRNYQAIEEIKKFAAEKKPQYAAVKEALDDLMKMPG
jgi:hypothetical protein